MVAPIVQAEQASKVTLAIWLAGWLACESNVASSWFVPFHPAHCFSQSCTRRHGPNGDRQVTSQA